jgi:hypothetical protein
MGKTALIHQLFDFQPRYDLGVIQLDSQFSNAPEMYLNETGSSTAMVAGMSNGIPAGANYCISATRLQPNCNILSGDQILLCGSQVDPPIPFGRCIYYISYTSINGNYIGCLGDSGGPIYYWSGSNIIAAGIQSPGARDDTGCFTRGAASVVSSAVNRYNISGLRVLTI